MIPRLTQGLADLAGKLMRDIAPQAANRYAMADVGMIGMLLAAVAVDTERAVAVRMADIDDMKSLFMEAPGHADPAHRPDRAAFLDRAPASLNLSDIDAMHADGLSLLIALHAWAEDAQDELEARIWEFLARHTERNRLDAQG
jgi:hypothetical protein